MCLRTGLCLRFLKKQYKRMHLSTSVNPVGAAPAAVLPSAAIGFISEIIAAKPSYLTLPFAQLK